MISKYQWLSLSYLPRFYAPEGYRKVVLQVKKLKLKFYNTYELWGKWGKSKKFGTEEPSWDSEIILWGIHQGMILLCIGTGDFPIYLKFRSRETDVITDSMNGPLLCFKLTVFSKHRGYLLLHISIIWSARLWVVEFDPHLCPAFRVIESRELRCKKGLSDEDGARRQGGEEKGRQWPSMKC